MPGVWHTVVPVHGGYEVEEETVVCLQCEAEVRHVQPERTAH